MNELQQVLLVFAVVVIVAIYFYSRAKSNKTESKKDFLVEDKVIAEEIQPEEIFAELEEDKPKSPVYDEYPLEEIQEVEIEVVESPKIEPHKLDKDHPLYVPENQGKLPLDDFTLQAPPSSVSDVIEIKTAPAEDKKVETSEQEEKTYAILVLNLTEDLTTAQVIKEMEALQLTENSRGFYEKVEKDEQIFMVANALEPGTFREDLGANPVTQGVILILNLPNPVVPAPRAMGDLIDMSRRLSQRLNGKMYNAQRQLMRETDLQSMREAALDYESTKLAN